MASNHGGRGAGADTGRRGRLVLRSGAAAPENGKRKRPHPGSGAAGGGLKKQKEKSLMHGVCIRDFAHGAVNAIRTHDLILTKDVLYHLSHISKPHYLRMLEYYTQGTTLLSTLNLNKERLLRQ